jgi:replication factor A1
MAIKDLKARDGNVDIEIEISEKSEVREFQKFGKAGRVCNAKGKDETGTITLTLWNEDIDKVNVGDKVHITNGYISEWQGELQLGTGKFGQMEVVGKVEGATAPAASAPAEPAAVTEEPIDVEEEKVE